MISPEAQLPFITRVQPPKRRDHNVHCERLIKSVSENLSKKVQLVTAPAGYGKTALLVQLASELDLPTCWYSFAPEDNEPESLLRFCLQSIRTRFPEFGATYRPLTKKGLETDWLTKCGLLVSAIETDIDDDFILFFDDLHWIEGKPESLECVSLLIERSPSNVHFVLSSRTRPTLPCLPKLAANDDLHALDVGDLRFSAKETGHLLSNLWGQSVTAKDAEKVTEQTGGWAAGIVLTAKTPTASGLAEAGNTGNQSILFEYLTTEVFDKLPNSLQQFLLRTSILREFTGAICDNILGLSNSDRLIDQIKNTGLFLEERAGEVATFAYHDLFREYLERRFQLEFHSDYLRISRRAAYWYRELGDDDAAIYHYLQIGEAGEVAEIVKQTSGSYFDQRGWGKLAGWLDRLPSSVLESDPELLLLSGRILAIRVGDPTGALERFDKVLASNSSHNPEIAGKALVAKSTAYRRLGDLARALKTARDGLAVLEKIECSPDQIAEAHRQVGSALATGGDLELGRQHFQTALQHTSPDNMSLLSLICDGLAVACIELGELDQAAVHLEHARTGWLKLGSEGPLAGSLINLALVYYHQGEFDLAFDEAAEALRVAEASGYPRLVATALVRQASIQQALGQNEDALTASSRALEFARELLDQRLIAESTNNIGHAYWKMGEVSKAEVLLNQALLQADDSGQDYITANYHINLGKVYCHERSYDQALGHLKKALELLADHKSIARDAEANIYLAAICYRKGKLREALDYLALVANLLAELGHDGFLLAEGDELLDVIRFGAARRVGGGTFSRIVKRLVPMQLAEGSFDRSSTENPEFPQFPTLQAFGFGVSRVTMDSHPVSDVEWSSRKAKEIFFFLLCNQRPLGNEELLDALWPDASMAMSDSALKTSIYRLRQALFYECISVQDTGYGINPEVPIHFDVDQFQQHLTLATRTKQGSGSRENHLQKAIQLYDGQFLSGFYSEWCRDLRTDLELKYHSALMGLAEYHVVRGRFLEAADLIEKVVSSDPYNEEAQYRLVDSLINANEPLIALQHLRKYIKVCREELGV